MVYLGVRVLVPALFAIVTSDSRQWMAAHVASNRVATH